MEHTFTEDRFPSFNSDSDLEGLDVALPIIASSLPTLDMLSLLPPNSFDVARYDL
jgi:hypothetical protein